MKITLADIGKEPFRIFFPWAVVAGILGVALWPLYFTGATQLYPVQTHPRVMVYGFFGGFIFGFLGTAMPRMLSVKPFRLIEVFAVLALHAAAVVSLLSGKVAAGDALFLGALLLFLICLLIRFFRRRDTPPPGFILVALAFLCVLSGTGLAILQNYREMDPFWLTLQKLLSCQGFVLLPILGIGPFILPRFFNLQNTHDFPESLKPPAGWIKKAALALAAGIVLMISFFAEAGGWLRCAHWLRFATVLIFFLIEIPLRSALKGGGVFGAVLRLAFLGILGGFLTVALFPAYRVGLLHLTLIGGFAIVTLSVATRVIFGHSGNLSLLSARNRWMWAATGIMLFAMATRISGDFWPKIMVSHYVYGSLLWIGGILVWAFFVLPKVRTADTGD